MTAIPVERELLERVCPKRAADGWLEWNTAEAYEASKELRKLLAEQPQANSQIVAKKILNAEQMEPIAKYITDGDRQPNPSKMYRVTIEQLD